MRITPSRALREYRGVVGAIIGLSLFCVGQVASQTGDAGAKQFRVLWSRAVRPLVSMAITPDGKYTAALARDGSLAYFDAIGVPLWRKDVGKANQVVVSANGKVILTFSALNPIDRDITVMSADGGILFKRRISAAVWSAALSADGRTAIVGSGDCRAYIFTFGARGSRYHRHRLPGLPMSISFVPGTGKFVVGMWQDSGVAMFTLKGAQLWWTKGKTTLQYLPRVSANGRYLVAVATPNRDLPEAEVGFWNAAGTNLWRKRMIADDVHVAVSPAGDLVATSYRQLMVHKGKTMTERRLALYNRSGTTIWEKGGMFFKPALISMFPGNHILASSEQNTLYLLDPQGKITQLEVPAAIRQAVPAPSVGRAAVYCGDGRLYMVGS